MHINNSNGLKKWYPNTSLLQGDLAPGYCVIGRPDDSFGIIVFSNPVLQASAEKILEETKKYYAAISLKFEIYKSLCNNCRKKEIADDTNVCPTCLELFNRSGDPDITCAA